MYTHHEHCPVPLHLEIIYQAVREDEGEIVNGKKRSCIGGIEKGFERVHQKTENSVVV